MQDRIQIKHNGAYITLPELVRKYGKILLEYKPAWVRLNTDSEMMNNAAS